MNLVRDYLSTLVVNQQDTFTNEFEAVTSNLGKIFVGLVIVRRLIRVINHGNFAFSVRIGYCNAGKFVRVRNRRYSVRLVVGFAGQSVGKSGVARYEFDFGIEFAST